MGTKGKIAIIFIVLAVLIYGVTIVWGIASHQRYEVLIVSLIIATIVYGVTAIIVVRMIRLAMEEMAGHGDEYGGGWEYALSIIIPFMITASGNTSLIPEPVKQLAREIIFSLRMYTMFIFLVGLFAIILAYMLIRYLFPGATFAIRLQEMMIYAAFMGGVMVVLMFVIPSLMAMILDALGDQTAKDLAQAIRDLTEERELT